MELLCLVERDISRTMGRGGGGVGSIKNIKIVNIICIEKNSFYSLLICFRSETPFLTVMLKWMDASGSRHALTVATNMP